jgi:signal transduction histidine kinase
LDHFVDEAVALAEISRLITSSTELDEVFDVMAESISALVPADTLSISIVDLEIGTYSTLIRWGRELPGYSVGTARSLAGTTAEKAIANGIPLVIADDLILEQASNDADPAGYPLADLKSWLVAPLIVGGNAIGIMHFRARAKNAYTERHIGIAERVANQIAGTIAIADLNRNLAISEKQQIALADLAAELAESDKATVMYESIDKTLTKFFEFDRISILTASQSKKSATQVYQRGVPVPGIEIGAVLELSNSLHEFELWANELTGTSTGGEYLRAKFPVVSHSVLGLESRMRVPMTTKTGYVGAIALNHRDKNAYSPEDQHLLRRVASQSAPALEKSFLLEETKEEARIQSSLARLGRLVASDLQLSSIYETVADELKELVPYDRIAISRFETQSRAMAVDFVRGIALPNAMPGDDITDPGKVIDWEFSGSDSDLAHGTSTRAENEFKNNLEREGLVSWIQAPIGIRSTGLIGFLSVRSTVANVYNDAHLELLKIVALQITPAIQSARLEEQSEKLSEQRERAETLDEENIELQRLADARSEFLSTVSHELRTPLTSISAFSDILSRNRAANLTNQQIDQIEVVRRSTSSLTGLIDDLLDVSRADTGRLNIEKAPFDIDALFSEFTADAMSMIDAKNQILKTAKNKDRIWIDADRSRITQILNNLISNASKYSPANAQIDLRVNIARGKLTVEVEDHGIGISSHDVGNVFTPFFRAPNKETRNESGTGLGLSVVKTLINLHGGDIEITSDLGSGSIVRFWIPGVTSSPGQNSAED